MSRLDQERSTGALSASGCGAGTQIITGAFIGAIAGYVFAIVTGRDERACTVAAALAGAILLPIVGC